MKQETFITRYQAEWVAFEQWLNQRRRSAVIPRAREAQGGFDDQMPARYRRLCHQAALAHRRGYSPRVTARLQMLIQRGHDVLYRAPPTRWRQIGRFVLADFPRLVRAQRGCLWLAAALFVGALCAMFALTTHWPELAHAMFEPEQLAEFEAMYAQGSPHFQDGRGSQGNVQMFGFYIFNNIGIGFRTFASGLLGGVGTALALVFNGVYFGVIAAHLHNQGQAVQFWPFVAGHSAPELIAIVIAGAAGLRLGLALIAPGRWRRIDALRRAGWVGAQLCAGVLLMLLLAAFIEAFWSAQPGIAAAVKFGVGGGLWGLLAVWLGLGGRGLDVHDARWSR